MSQIKEFYYKNGAKCFFIENKDMEEYAVGIRVNFGNINEEILSKLHLAEHFIAGPLNKYFFKDADEIEKKFEEEYKNNDAFSKEEDKKKYIFQNLKMFFNSNIQVNHNCFGAMCKNAEYLEDFLNDFHKNIALEGISEENRKEEIEEIKKEFKSYPSCWDEKLSRQAEYGEEPYAAMHCLGNLSVIEKISLEDIKKTCEAYYNPSNMIFVVEGSNYEEVQKIMEKTVGSQKNTPNSIIANFTENNPQKEGLGFAEKNHKEEMRLGINMSYEQINADNQSLAKKELLGRVLNSLIKKEIKLNQEDELKIENNNILEKMSLIYKGESFLTEMPDKLVKNLKKIALGKIDASIIQDAKQEILKENIGDKTNRIDVFWQKYNLLRNFLFRHHITSEVVQPLDFYQNMIKNVSQEDLAEEANELLKNAEKTIFTFTGPENNLDLQEIRDKFIIQTTEKRDNDFLSNKGNVR